MSSAELPIADTDRILDVEQKHRLVTEFLASGQLDALLIQEPGNFAWFTTGGNCAHAGSSEPAAALFLTPQARVVVCGNADSGQLFDRELPGLGFQLKERPWYEDRHVLIADLVRGRRTGSDMPFEQAEDRAAQIAAMRLPLSEHECGRLRQLGRLVIHAVEATARNCDLFQTEAEIAGELCHRLIRHGVSPERIQVWADGSGRRYRYWSYGDACVEHTCVLSAVGRQNGLYVGASRTVCFERPSQEFVAHYQRALLVQATGMFFSKVNWALADTWSRVERIYDKFGVSEEWRLADQADVTGYAICEAPVVPDSSFRLDAAMPVFWHPTVGPCRVGDTILVGSPRTRSQRGFEILTPVDNWPTVRVDVKGVPIVCPGILRRERGRSLHR